jgi:hypothetical protein
MNQTPYGPAAYRASDLPDLAPPVHQKNRLLDTPLTWGNYAFSDSISEIEEQLDAVKINEDNAKDSAKKYCTEERWNFENTQSTPTLYLALKICCFFFPWVFWLIKIELLYKTDIAFFGIIIAFANLALLGSKKPVFAYALLALGALISGFLILGHEGAETIHWLDQTAYLTGLALALIGVLGADAMLWVFSVFYRHDGSGFNRHDGMVRIGRRFRTLFVAPFYEFDPVMQLQVTPHGGHDHVLWLYHRYTDTSVCLGMKMHSLGLDKANLFAFWDTLQRYMDVEQPLPDLPVLEQRRHLDPVTAAHDAAIGRPERYWRDFNVETWKRKNARQLREKLANYPWQQQPCTLQARIDPNLSVETYYRRQEAKGIQATPKGDDFDNIHRC